MTRRAWSAWLAAWLALACAARALGPLETLVVVNPRDKASRALGEHYMAAHGIPASHRCETPLSGTGHEMSPEAFEREVRGPVEAHLERTGLRAQIQAVVFCWEAPTRVGFNGLTAAWYYGFKAKKEGAPTCHIADDSRNRYYLAERPYRAAAGWTPLKSPLAFVLTARTPEDARAAVDGAVASEGTRPMGAAGGAGGGKFVLAGSSDAARAVRTRLHAGVAAQFAREGWAEAVETRGNAPPEPEAPMEVCSLGQGNLPKAWATNGTRMAAGGIGDNLTSCGGQLPKPCYGQHGVWDWLAMGASASYGTVSEPCNFTAKFPHPVYAYYYARGWSAAEALWMSVENPYQGLFAGDPLAAPHAAKPRVEIESPAPGATAGADTALELRVKAAEAGGAPPVYLDLYIDGRHYTPMARPIGASGNEVRVRVGEKEYRYTVQRDDDLYGVAEGVAWTVRNGSGGAVQARAHGDSVTLGWAGEEVAVGAEVAAGLAPAARMGAKTCTERSVAEGEGRQGAEVRLWMGTAREYPLKYPIDLSFLAKGRHTLTVVARDGTAVQAQGQASVEVVSEGAR